MRMLFLPKVSQGKLTRRSTNTKSPVERVCRLTLVPVEFVRFALAETHAAFEATTQRLVERFEEFALVPGTGLPPDLAANRFHNFAHRFGIVLPQDAFEHLQLVLAIDGQFRFPEIVFAAAV